MQVTFGKSKIFSLVLVSLSALPALTLAKEGANLPFKGNLAEAHTNKSGDSQDGFFIQTMKGSKFVAVGGGGAGPSSGLDTRVVSKYSISKDEAITPRKGNYFIVSTIYKNKDYSSFTGNVKDAPRSNIGIQHADLRTDFDQLTNLKFSIYTPKSLPNDGGTKGVVNGTMLMTVLPVQNDDSNNRADTRATVLSLNQWVPTGESESHWILKYSVDAKSTQESKSNTFEKDLGPVGPDRGKWTDFVVRYRVNPYSRNTGDYKGNKGSLEVWKSVGSVDAKGDRQKKYYKIKYNEPFGLVPKKNNKLVHFLRVYKYGWKVAANKSTIKGPITYGFDEMYLQVLN